MLSSSGYYEYSHRVNSRGYRVGFGLIRHLGSSASISRIHGSLSVSASSTYSFIKLDFKPLCIRLGFYFLAYPIHLVDLIVGLLLDARIGNYSNINFIKSFQVARRGNWSLEPISACLLLLFLKKREMWKIIEDRFLIQLVLPAGVNLPLRCCLTISYLTTATTLSKLQSSKSSN